MFLKKIKEGERPALLSPEIKYIILFLLCAFLVVVLSKVAIQNDRDEKFIWFAKASLEIVFLQDSIMSYQFTMDIFNDYYDYSDINVWDEADRIYFLKASSKRNSFIKKHNSLVEIYNNESKWNTFYWPYFVTKPNCPPKKYEKIKIMRENHRGIRPGGGNDPKIPEIPPKKSKGLEQEKEKEKNVKFS